MISITITDAFPIATHPIRNLRLTCIHAKLRALNGQHCSPFVDSKVANKKLFCAIYGITRFNCTRSTRYISA